MKYFTYIAIPLVIYDYYQKNPKSYASFFVTIRSNGIVILIVPIDLVVIYVVYIADLQST